MKSSPKISDALRKQAIDRLLRTQSEHCTDKDRAELAAWLQKHTANRHAYETVEAQWQLLEPLKNKDFPAREAALRYRPKARVPLWAYSAAAALLLALGLTAYNPNGWPGMTHTYIAQKGDRQTINLADGSRLELNTDSKVRAHYDHWQRSVELIQGEAFFTVAHDAKRPFEVRAGKGRIRDIGTAFEVYRKPNDVLVAVQEGVVEVDAQGTRKLTAGQHTSFNQNGEFLKDQNQDLTNLTAWRQGQLVFRNRRLEDVLNEIGRYHEQKVTMKDKNLAVLKVSGTFRTDNLNDLLNAIAAILPVKVDYVGGKDIVLKSARK